MENLSSYPATKFLKESNSRHSRKMFRPNYTSRLILSVLVCCIALLLPAYADLPGKKSFDSDGVEIKYLEVGEGTPVLLIHGFAASALTNWARVIPRLSRNHRVIALDNRGHGGSGKPVGEEHYGDEMILDSIRLLDYLGIKKAHIVGYSMGGYITAKMLTMYPDRMISATIAGAGWAKEKSIREETLNELANAIDRDRSVAPLFKKLDLDKENEHGMRMRLANRFIMFSNHPDALASVARGMKQHTETKEDILAIKVPTQLIVGSEDPIAKAAEAWGAIRPDHSLTIIDGANHMSTIMRAEFAQTIEGFVEKIDGYDAREH